MNDEDVLRRNVNDTLFRKLFSIRRYQADMLREMVPGLEEINEEKIQNVELSSVFTKGVSNDLALRYENTVILMAEEQTQWDEGLPYRFIRYQQEMQWKIFDETYSNMHIGRVDESRLPFYSLAIIYVGEGHEKEDDIDIDKIYPGLMTRYHIRVYHEGPVKNGIVDDYISFVRQYRRKHFKERLSPRKAIEETIDDFSSGKKISDFINQHKGEIEDMTMQFDSQEEITRQIMKQEREEGIKQGLSVGLKKGMQQGLQQGIEKGKEETLTELIQKHYSYFRKTMNDAQAKKQIMLLDDVDLDTIEKVLS